MILKKQQQKKILKHRKIEFKRFFIDTVSNYQRIQNNLILGQNSKAER